MNITSLKTSAILFITSFALTFFSFAQEHDKPIKLSVQRLDELEKDYYRWFKNKHGKCFDLYRIHKVDNKWSIDSAYMLSIENDVVYPYVNNKIYECSDDIGLYKNSKVSFRECKGQILWIKDFAWMNRFGGRVDGNIISHHGAIVELGIIDTSSDWESRFNSAYPYWSYYINKHGSVVFKHEPSDDFTFLFASDSGKYLVFKYIATGPTILLSEQEEGLSILFATKILGKLMTRDSL